MDTDLLNNPNYRQREKKTRTRVAARIWQQLSNACPPKGVSGLFKEHTHIEAEFEPLLKGAKLDSVRAVFDTKEGALVTTAGLFGGEDVSRMEVQDGAQLRTFYVKRYWNREFRRNLKRATRGSIFGPSIMAREFKKMKDRIGPAITGTTYLFLAVFIDNEIAAKGEFHLRDLGPLISRCDFANHPRMTVFDQKPGPKTQRHRAVPSTYNHAYRLRSGTTQIA